MDEKNINDINENEVEDATSTSETEVNETTAEAEANKPEDAVAETVEENASEVPETAASDTTESPVTSEAAIEEQPEPSLDSYTTPKVEPAAYAFRWDYSDQKRYDVQTKKKSGASRGVVTYAIILTVAFLLSIAVLVGALLFGDLLSESPVRDPMLYSDALALDELYDYCLQSYVAISVVTENGTEGVGSGIVITDDGYISTNYHVVEGAKKITVITSTGSKLDATYIDGDEVNDIAVVKVSSKKLIPAVLGKSSNTKVGERVMAIGTPYSTSYAGSMTAGYVSGIERQYAVKNDNGTVNKILKLIQTDTSVNPGNSGGPLFNMNGEVIGIVTMKIAGSNYEGMGFAIPIDGVIGMIYDIIENGEITDENSGSAVKGAALGISGHEVVEDKKYLMTADYCIEVFSDEKGDYIEWSVGLSKEKIYVTDTDTLNAMGLDGAYPYHAPATGVMVKTTSEGFDSNEKLKYEDVIVSANGISCNTMSVLQEIIFNSRIGDILHLEVCRNGSIIEIDVELGTANSME